MKKVALVIILILIAGAGWTHAQTADKTSQDAMKAYQDAEKAYVQAGIEVQRTNLRKQKRDVIKAFTTFTDTQEKAFWPVYDNYEKELTKINDQRLELIKDYAAHYGTLTDEKALELSARSIDFQEKRVSLRKSYMEDLKKILPGVLVARLMQLENQTDLLIDLDIASQVPLAK